jgi:hypothetical protein
MKKFLILLIVILGFMTGVITAHSDNLWFKIVVDAIGLTFDYQLIEYLLKLQTKNNLIK